MNVVITGATKGIGRAMANLFAAAGHQLIVCARSLADLQLMEQEMNDKYTAALKYKATDLGDEAQVKAFGKWIIDEQMHPDILINNAGLFNPGTCYEEADGLLQKMMQVNVYAAYSLTRMLLPDMIDKRCGQIFNICSVASIKAFANVGAYGISKFALLGFTKNLREEMKPFGIKVTAVCPGATLTASWDGVEVDAARIMDDNDIAKMVYAASQLSAKAVVEDIIIRPQLGDL